MGYFVSFQRGEGANTLVKNDPKGRTREEVILDFLKDNKEKLGRVLLVTDFIESGETIVGAADLFDKAGIDFDVAAVSSSRSVSQNSRINDLRQDNRLIEGSFGSVGRAFYDNLRTGVTKRPLDRSRTVPHPVKDNSYDRNDIIRSRQDTRKVADYLFNKIGREE